MHFIRRWNSILLFDLQEDCKKEIQQVSVPNLPKTLHELIAGETPKQHKFL
ncbi:hypothetical protein JHK84_043776 [Glycine max]|uniref:Uncharacterized protein n=1 Tax=Glycine soja TaxID=3848 RepID=A0A0B2RBT8_GLYSO|nr:hypothetical protein JHK86_043588 [Glycine max]KAG4957878.1 hypothetical protein JHK85_044258 [Glycine max]KAG5117663.1 hypothetical protein JHK84_043776 [Glycine max]KHN29844.1 hypothetical protein glysoja_034088 [Glycine soja]